MLTTWIRFLLFILFNIISCSAKCGYEACHPTEEYTINVHIICHSHNDVGWVKTPDEYFDQDVSTIIRNVLTSLEKNPSRKYIQVESYYLFKYLEAYPKEFERIKKLIENGQFEITGGGWSMNDEAVTHYQSIIDQMTFALRKLNDTFGKCALPRVGWQIDPFGHSREMASIFALMGYDGLFFARISFDDLKLRTENLRLEEIWSGNDDLGKANEIFFSILKNHYTTPSERLFFEDKFFKFSDLNQTLQHVYKIVMNTASSYRSRNVILLMGGDFTYRQAENWFSNIDGLIEHSKKVQLDDDYEFDIFYSTPACYIKALNDEKFPWTVYSGDFFPYATDNYSYWTGFFTSRPAFKYFERRSNNLLQVAKQIQFWSNGTNKYIKKLQSQMGVIQHHDSITGTSTQDVNKDYRSKLNDAFEKAQNETFQNINAILGENLPFEKCNYFNLSQCHLTENAEQFITFIYNPLGQYVSQYVRLPIQNYSYEIFDSKGNSVNNDVIPIGKRVLDLLGRESNATHEIVFLAENIPPLGFSLFFLQRSNETKNVRKFEDNLTLIKGQNVVISFDYRHRMYSVSFGNVTIPVNQDFFIYSTDETLPSGLYVSRPIAIFPETKQHFPVTKLILGSLVEEVHQELNNYISQVIRIYKTENHVELDWIIGPLPNNTAYELIMQFTTSLNSKRIFYTDSNGRQTLKRESKNGKKFFPISKNYYPVTSKISIEDEVLRFSVLTDRSQGGSSLQDGELQLLVHRRLTKVNAFGLYEWAGGLEDMNYPMNLQIRGQHYLFGGAFTNKSLRFEERQLALKKLLKVWYFLIPANKSVWNNLLRNRNFTKFGLKNPLPDNVHLLTLEKIDNVTILLRFEHLSEASDNSKSSQHAIVDISNIFNNIKIQKMRETTLAANQWISESRRFKWHKWFVPESDEPEVDTKFFQWNNSNFEIKLKPMEIRTFIAKIYY